MTAALIAVAAALIAVLVYAASCWWWPLAHCYCCKGAGKHGRADGRVFRACRWCKGTGRRWRIGRKIWNWLHRHNH